MPENVGFWEYLIPGDYTQLYCFQAQDPTGVKYPPDIRVIGPIELILTEGYVPAGGTDFLLIQTGPFQWLFDTLDPAILTYPKGTPSLVTTDAPLPEGMWWEMWHDAEKLGVTAVPEPGTLVLLSMGTLALLAYAWRKASKPPAKHPENVGKYRVL